MTQSSEPKQFCKLCAIEVMHWSRYPAYVCNTCAEKITDIEGRSVVFSNIDISGGLIGHYRDNEQPYESNICFIEGVKCYAKEARFGGVVIEVVNE